MELYESMIEEQRHTSKHKRVILDTIQKQALQNLQIRLHDNIKLIIRSQHYTTLQEAMTEASAEEKVKVLRTDLFEIKRTIAYNRITKIKLYSAKNAES